MATKPDPFPITAAQLSGCFCGAVLYGMYLVSCMPCLRILLITGRGREERWRRLNEIRWLMVIAGLLLFVICTLDVALGLSCIFRAFVHSTNATKSLIADWTNTARAQALGLLVADFILIYRCWIVYGRRWLAIAPSLTLYLANWGIGIRLYELTGASGGLPGGVIVANAGAFRAWLLAFLVAITAQNILTTSILIWRIWKVDRDLKILEDQPRYLRNLIHALAESGAAYTAFVLMTMTTMATHSNALYPISDMASAGLVFNIILVRCSPERDRQFTTFAHNEVSSLKVVRQGTTQASESVVFNQSNTMPHDIKLPSPDSHCIDGQSTHNDLELEGSIRFANKEEVESRV
ncbi:hypothetical protein AN958_09154 [Leucoagaricus sp. SymC.cos]|nr:hypothetical protein AN958_09154 [Leucoagaricus sp. SymC.cos]